MIPKKIMMVLCSPHKLFKGIEREGFKQTFTYSATLSLIPCLAYIITFYFNITWIPHLNMMPVVVEGIITYILILMAFFLSAGFYHIFIRIVRGKGNYLATYKALVYGATPTLLLGWVPRIGIISSIYGMYLLIIGLSLLHEISFIISFAIVTIPWSIIRILLAILEYLIAV